MADRGMRGTARRVAILAATLIAVAAAIPVLQNAIALADGRRGWDPFAPVQLAIVVVPALAAVLLGASTLIGGRLLRTLAVVAAAAVSMAALRLLMGALVNPLPLAEAAFLVPACAYAVFNRKPLWWVASVAAGAPLVLVLSASFYA